MESLSKQKERSSVVMPPYAGEKRDEKKDRGMTRWAFIILVEGSQAESPSAWEQ
jgi:hypothetical protein